MQLGKKATELTAALVLGATAMLTPLNLGNYHFQPAIVYAAETAAPKVYPKGIPNKTGECSYLTKMPVKVHYEKLPAGVDKSKVKVFDKEGCFHHVAYYDDWSDPNDSLIPKNSWVRGGATNVLMSMKPDIMSVDQLNGMVLSPGKEYVVFLYSWMEDSLATSRREGNRVYIKSTKLGWNKTPYQDSSSNSVKITKVDTGASVNPIALQGTRRGIAPNPRELNYNTGKGERVYAGFENYIELTYTVPGTSFEADNSSQYFCYNYAFHWVFNPEGYPSGDYMAEINTPAGVRKVPFKINNPNGPDPKIALKLGMDYVFENCKISGDLFNPRSEYNNEVMKLSGMVTFDFSDILDDNRSIDKLTVTLRKEGEINGKTLYQSTVSSPFELPLNTMDFSNGKYAMDLRFIDKENFLVSPTGRRNIEIQNPPVTAKANQ